MRGLLCCFMFALSVSAASAQTAMVRIEVRSDGEPVVAADVFVNGMPYKTNAEGVVLVTVPPGHADIVVTKDGFVPTSASV